MSDRQGKEGNQNSDTVLVFSGSANLPKKMGGDHGYEAMSEKNREDKKGEKGGKSIISETLGKVKNKNKGNLSLKNEYINERSEERCHIVSTNDGFFENKIQSSTELKEVTYQPSDKPVLSEEKKSNVSEDEVKPETNLKTTQLQTTQSINEKENEKTQREIPRKMLVINSPFNRSLPSQRNDKCIICNVEYAIISLFHSNSCLHYFCRKCLKNYYEDKIEQGNFDYTCPVFTCTGCIEKNFLKVLISKQHFLAIDKKTCYSNLTNEIELPVTKVDQFRCYTQKHVLDIGTNESFYMFNKAKSQFCPRCNEPALFGKSGTHFVKCLNCYFSICKYCLKEYDEDHMNLANPDHCKIAYRRQDEEEEERGSGSACCKKLTIEFLLVLVSYYFVFYGGFVYIRKGVEFFLCLGGKAKNCFSKILINLIGFVFFLVAFPIILMSFAYFPVFISIFN